jgi:ribose/xylose/arabinose/galactoside ABC-type transport system permease subunit
MTEGLKIRLVKLRDDGQIIWVTVLILLILAMFRADNFATSRNLTNVLGQYTSLMLVTAGMLVVVVTGNIDLSVASQVRLVAVLMSGIADGNTIKFFSALAIVTFIAGFVGWLNAWIINTFSIDAFIVTLGMSIVLEGFAYAYTEKGEGAIPESISNFVYGSFGPLPFVFVVGVAMLILLVQLLNRTQTGLWMYAVGGDAAMARRTGINVKRTVTKSFILCALLTMTAAVVQVSRQGIGAPSTGSGVELLAITAVVMGGATLGGGKGKVSAVVGGAMLLTLMNNVLNLTGISQYWQTFVRGLIVVVGVGIFSKRLLKR